MQDHWGYDKDKQPDIVEVVRCRNCRWGSYDELLNVYWCDGVAHTDDFFCANGRKKKTTQSNDSNALSALARGEANEHDHDQ